MKNSIDDPRLISAQCFSLTPVETVHQNPWFAVRNRKGFFTIEYNTPQVLILPIVDNKSIILVRVKRPVVNDITLELPAGGTNKDELPINAASRELEEETGVAIRDIGRFQILPPLIHMPRSPILPYIFQVYLSTHEFLQRQFHDGEIDSVECFSFDEIVRKINEGEIYIGLQVAILARYLIHNRIIK